MHPTLSLNSGYDIPLLGFGTWQLEGDQAYQSVKMALKAGYRHIDTAERYGNHQEVGQAIAESGIPRKELFLTSKIWRENLQPEVARQVLPRFLKELQIEYLDLLLIHWPNMDVDMNETFKIMRQWQEQGILRSFGVSNFTVHHLQNMLKAGFIPAMNQVEFHCSLNQETLRSFCEQQNIALTAYSPIAQGYDLRLPQVEKLSQKYQKSSSQVILNWLRQKNIVAIPRSADEQHIQDNLASLEWNLEPEDVLSLDGLNENYRVVCPDFADFGY